MTHGGICLGRGLIHDRVGFGNRDVRVSDFYAEAADPGPEPSIQPRELVVEGVTGIAVNERRGLMAAADYLAEDVDPGCSPTAGRAGRNSRRIAPALPAVPIGQGFGGPSTIASIWQRQILSASTYRSFTGATRSFTVVR